MAAEPARKKARLEYKDTFTVLVGPLEQSYTLHMSIAAAKSHFFRAAFNGRFKEARERKIRLTEVKTADFEIYMQWLYNDTISVPEATQNNYSEVHNEQLALAKLYGLGSMLLDIGLQNSVIDVLAAAVVRTHKDPGAFIVKWCYDNTPTGCTLQRFVVDLYAYSQVNLRLDLEPEKDNLPLVFFKDLMLRIAKFLKAKVSDPALSVRCDYHEHDDEHPKCTA